MAVEMAEIVKMHLNIHYVKTQFYSNNKIVLGYISNHTKRFHNYVWNAYYDYVTIRSGIIWNLMKT